MVAGVVLGAGGTVAAGDEAAGVGEGTVAPGAVSSGSWQAAANARMPSEATKSARFMSTPAKGTPPAGVGYGLWGAPTENEWGRGKRRPYGIGRGKRRPYRLDGLSGSFSQSTGLSRMYRRTTLSSSSSLMTCS